MKGKTFLPSSTLVELEKFDIEPHQDMPRSEAVDRDLIFKIVNQSTQDLNFVVVDSNKSNRYVYIYACEKPENPTVSGLKIGVSTIEDCNFLIEVEIPPSTFERVWFSMADPEFFNKLQKLILTQYEKMSSWGVTPKGVTT